MRIHLSLIPDEIIREYNLLELAHDGYVYIEINKGMYGLPQAGILANKLLARRLAKKGYHQAPHTPGLWKHTSRPIQFTLVADDFGVEYVGREHAEHLLQALQEHYTVSTDWTGSLYCGMHLKWDYVKRTLEVRMPGYITDILHKYQHPPPAKPQHAPYQSRKPQYGVKVQLTDPPDTAPHLGPKECK